LFRADDTIDWERWAEIPILTRRDIQANDDGLLARALPNLAGETGEDTSSGSTGTPIRHVTTGIQDMASACASERFFRWHGIQPDKLTVRVVATRNPDAVLPHGRLKPAWRIGHRESVAIDLNIRTAVADQIAFVRDMGAAYLMTYPTNFREIARVSDETAMKLSLDAILTVGEMVTGDVREIIRLHFGSEPLDRYGASEVGHIAATCPECNAHHVAAELVLIEIVGDDGKTLPPGEPGRLIATPFYSLAMPFIRYEVGDFASLSPEPCACGRTLPVLSRILGRTRNVFRFADGSSVWPVLYSAEMHALVPNRQYQIVQHTPVEIEFRYVPAHGGAVPDAAGMTAYMRAKLHPTVSVRLTPMASIPRSAGGKYEDYLSLVEPDRL
jgi:phenylacetate-CoA ligase